MGVLDILLAILGISVLVVIHEGGHYLAARAFGMRVVRFSIGLGPTIFKFQPKGSPTTFQVAAIPFLAYVQIAGMNPHEEVDENDPGLYSSKGAFARSVTIFAGPFANYLAASLIFFGLALVGLPDTVPVSPVTIGSIDAGTPAAEAGLKEKDVILFADGKPVKEFKDLVDFTKERAGQRTAYIIERNGERLEPIWIVPADLDGRGVIGVRPLAKRAYAPPMEIAEAGKMAMVFPYLFTVANLEGLASMFKRGSHKELTGPVGMGKMVAEQAARGPIDYGYILTLISVALGLFNLLPVPGLDGGRLAFLGYELVTRQRPNEKLEAVIHTVGLLFLLGVLVLVTFRDIWG